MSLILRIVRAGVVAAVVVALIGYGLERARFGPSDQTALSRIEAELRQRFDASAATLGAIAARVAADEDTGRAAPRDQAALKRLFDKVSAAVPEDEAGRTVGLERHAPHRRARRTRHVRRTHRRDGRTRGADAERVQRDPFPPFW